jgi:putative FmdB family regulatory protein
MPTYEYICRACGHAFEQFQNMSAEPTRTCPECGKDEVKRLISSGGGIVFKGSGFYATDYRKDGPPKEKKDSSGDSGDSGSAEGGSKTGKNESSGGSESKAESS